MMANLLLADQVAYLEYDVSLADGGGGSIGFSLGRMDADTIEADTARQAQGVAHGFISIECPGAPRHPPMWLETRTQIGLVVADEDPLSDELVEIIATYLLRFIGDIARILPGPIRTQR
jgi:hypothetical protein